MQERMKNKYLILWTGIGTLFALILIISCLVLTYIKADEIKNDLTNQCNENKDFVAELKVSMGTEMEPSFMIKEIYKSYDYVLRDSDVGFYSMLMDGEGNKLAEDQYYMIVRKNSKISDERIILLGKDFFGTEGKLNVHSKDLQGTDESGKVTFALSTFSSFEINGTCDDTFVYPKNIVWADLYDSKYEYVLDADDLGIKAFEQWAGSNLYEENLHDNNKFFVFTTSASFTYGDWEKCEKLNREAEEFCKEIYNNYATKKNTRNDQSKSGLFTAYVAGTGYLNEQYTCPYVFVFHPVSIAMKELSGVYLGAVLLGLLMLGISFVLVNKVYRQQLAYEKNRQELTRGVAHELKTPLAITKGYIENWSYMDEKDKEEYSKTISDEIDNMNVMVTDLLELSRMEARAKDINYEEIDLELLVTSVIKRVKPLADERNISVKLLAENDMVLINADLEMMRTVILNFVSNAIKYAKSEVEIKISSKGKKVFLSVINDGEAISKEKLSRLWDEFYRADDSSGSGLGLTIAKNILVLHNFKFGCSSVNEKNEFWFEAR